MTYPLQHSAEKVADIANVVYYGIVDTITCVIPEAWEDPVIRGIILGVGGVALGVAATVYIGL